MKKFRILIIVVILLGLIASAILFLPDSLPSKNEQVVEENKVSVVVAVSDLPLYTVITADMVQYKDIAESSVHPNAQTDISAVIGTTTLANIASGEVIMSNHVMTQDQLDGGLALIMDNGTRAMTVGVSNITGISYLMKVGNHVDIIIVTKELDRAFSATGVDERRNVAAVMFEDIEILALDQHLAGAPKNSDGAYEYGTVTLSLTPEQTAQVALASEEGHLYLALRPQQDHSVTGGYTVEINEILSGD